ncbi:uncharacterized protein LOC119568215 [Penaeus monodon]|uniref:uncharacterized protein LOC119568215 n=1 Tax=Penaeus monodon TaxID=6687 RepID=UPI0018A7998D|nr:uncharacterized protein LOC119568215 [Penaeus monodon]
MEDQMYFSNLASYVLRQLRRFKVLIKCWAAMMLVAAFLHCSGLLATFRRAADVAGSTASAADSLAASHDPGAEAGSAVQQSTADTGGTVAKGGPGFNRRGARNHPHRGPWQRWRQEAKRFSCLFRTDSINYFRLV